MQYQVIGMDGTDEKALSRRLAVREEHITVGKKLKAEGKVLFGYALLGDAGQMIGSVYLFEVSSKDELDQIIQNDPYTKGDVWKEIEIKEVKVPGFVL
jgi:uncharacterized protein